MIYDCIYVEDPIVTHRQCTDGSGNGINYSDSSGCVTPCDLKYMRHNSGEYASIQTHQIDSPHFWYNSFADILFQSLPNTCTDLIYNRRVNFTLTNTHVRTTNACTLQSKVGIGSTERIMLCSRFSTLIHACTTTCTQTWNECFSFDGQECGPTRESISVCKIKTMLKRRLHHSQKHHCLVCNSRCAIQLSISLIRMRI